MTTARAGRRPVVAVLSLLLGALLLWLSVPNLAPTVRAAQGDGVAGSFTARSLTCIGHPGHESCSWAGDYRSQDGRLARADVQLAGSGRGSLRAGQETAAIDVGREFRVYRPGGSREWMVPAGLLVAGLLLVILGLSRALPARTVPRAHSTR